MCEQVTILSYCFQTSENFSSAFKKVSFAVCETWRHCGMLKTVIVVNELVDCVRSFADENVNVEIQVEPSLVPGDIDTMSIDCNSRLYRRFNTPYVLIVQDDGYPLRAGLDEFVGKYDFIGAPYVRDIWWKNLICGALNCWCQNGGFSLRSRRICEAAASYWPKYASCLMGTPDVAEDLYYTRILPLHEYHYRHNFRLANNRESINFSYDALVPIPFPKRLPFGFHRRYSIDLLLQAYQGKINNIMR